MNSQKLQLKCIGAPRAPGVASVDEAGALGGCIDELDPFNGVIVGAVAELEGEALVGVNVGTASRFCDLFLCIVV